MHYLGGGGGGLGAQVVYRGLGALSMQLSKHVTPCMVMGRGVGLRWSGAPYIGRGKTSPVHRGQSAWPGLQQRWKLAVVLHPIHARVPRTEIGVTCDRQKAKTGRRGLIDLRASLLPL